MSQRDALRTAQRFVVKRYGIDDYPQGFVLDLCIEDDGQRCRSWSFDVRDRRDDRDAEDRDEATPDRVGYVHADGYVEGLY